MPPPRCAYVNRGNNRPLGKPMNAIQQNTKLTILCEPFEAYRSEAYLEFRGQSANPAGFYKIGSALAQGSEGDVFAAVRVPRAGNYTQVALKRVRINGAKARKHAYTELAVGAKVNEAMRRIREDRAMRESRNGSQTATPKGSAAAKNGTSQSPEKRQQQSKKYESPYSKLEDKLNDLTLLCKEGNAQSADAKRNAASTTPAKNAGGNSATPQQRQPSVKNIAAPRTPLSSRRGLEESPSSRGGVGNDSETPTSRLLHDIEKLAPVPWERGTGHPHILHLVDYFAGVDGLEREIFLVLERCDFALDDLIRGVRECRADYERKHGNLLPGVSAAASTPNLLPKDGRRGSTSSAKSGGSSSSTAGSYSQKKHRFSEAEIAKVFFQMLKALQFLNSLGILHRDMKTENVLWQRCQGYGYAKAGTLWCMAPEVLRGMVHDSSSDIWSLACVLYEMVYLDKPFNSMDLLKYQNSGTPLPQIIPGQRKVNPSPMDKRRMSGSVTQFDNAPVRVKPTWQKWVYSRNLRNLFMAMFETERMNRHSPKELARDEELVGPLRKLEPEAKPPIITDYKIGFTENEDGMVTAESFLKVLFQNLPAAQRKPVSRSQDIAHDVPVQSPLRNLSDYHMADQQSAAQVLMEAEAERWERSRSRERSRSAQRDADRERVASRERSFSQRSLSRSPSVGAKQKASPDRNTAHETQNGFANGQYSPQKSLQQVGQTYATAYQTVPPRQVPALGHSKAQPKLDAGALNLTPTKRMSVTNGGNSNSASKHNLNNPWSGGKVGIEGRHRQDMASIPTNTTTSSVCSSASSSVASRRISASISDGLSNAMQRNIPMPVSQHPTSNFPSHDYYSDPSSKQSMSSTLSSVHTVSERSNDGEPSLQRPVLGGPPVMVDYRMAAPGSFKVGVAQGQGTGMHGGVPPPHAGGCGSQSADSTHRTSVASIAHERFNAANQLAQQGAGISGSQQRRSQTHIDAMNNLHRQQHRQQQAKNRSSHTKVAYKTTQSLGGLVSQHQPGKARK